MKDETAVVTIHNFWVRPDFEAELILPADLTEVESKRISAIVATFGRKLYELPPSVRG